MWVLGDPKDWDTIKSDLWNWNNIAPLFEWLNSKFETRLVSKANKTLISLMQSFKSLSMVDDHQHAIVNNSCSSPVSLCRQNNSLSSRQDPFSVLIEPLLLAGNVTVVDSAFVERVVIHDKTATVRNKTTTILFGNRIRFV
jgi:hypothetical protein